MKELPILFSAPMVRALLEGKKTQTRRIMNPQPKFLQFHQHRGVTIYEGESRMWCWKDLAVENIWDFPNNDDRKCLALRAPYGKPADRLWVREAWQTGNKLDKSNATEIRNSCLDAGWSKPGAPIKYGADERITVWGDNDAEHFGPWGRKRSSRFMPRWASRLTLEITEVRVQRLQEISEEDARAEGLSCVTKDGTLYKYGIPDRDGLPGTDDDGWPWTEWDIDPRIAYFKLWNKINGKDAAQLNPWVWAVSFPAVSG